VTSASRAKVVAVGTFVSAASPRCRVFEALRALAVLCGWMVVFAPFVAAHGGLLGLTADDAVAARSSASSGWRRVARTLPLSRSWRRLWAMLSTTPSRPA